MSATLDYDPDIGADDDKVDVEEEKPGTCITKHFVECYNWRHLVIQCLNPCVAHSHDASIS